MGGNNGYDWGKFYEQKLEEEQADASEEGVHDITVGPERGTGKPEGGEANGQDDGAGGGDDTFEYRARPKAFPGVDLGLETPVGRIIHDKDVRDSILSYVDMMAKYASKEMLELPPFSLDNAHQHTVMDGVLVSILPNDQYTQVLFHFVTQDGIPCSISEFMELADLESTEKQIIKYINNRRREEMLGAKAGVIH